jgi:uncharacterized protein YjdB
MKIRGLKFTALALVVTIAFLSLQGLALAASISVTQISLNASKATITIYKNEKFGKTYQLKATVSPSDATNPSVKWASSNTKVAKVDANGKVTSVKKGTAVITATAADGSGKKASCTITVATSTKTIVQKVSLNTSKATITIYQNESFGKSLQLEATVSPSKASNPAVSWSSSNTSVATVSGTGRVVSKGVGEAIITAKAKDGSGKTASCKITVKTSPNTIVKSVKLNASTATITVYRNEKYGKSYQLRATVSPSNATNPAVSWKSSNTRVAKVDANGKVTSVNRGTAVITATTKDGSGKSASCTIKVVASSKIIVKGMTMNKTSFTLYDTQDKNFTYKYQLKVTFNPTNASKRTIKWTSSNSSVAKVSSSGMVTSVGLGTAIITAAAQDGSGKKATCTVTVKRVPMSLVYTKLLDPYADKVYDALNHSFSTSSEALNGFKAASDALLVLKDTCNKYDALKGTALDYVNTMLDYCRYAEESLYNAPYYQEDILDTLLTFKNYVTSL